MHDGRGGGRPTHEERRVFGRRIRDARERAGYRTGAEAARKIGMSSHQLLHLESGVRVPTYAVLNRLISGLRLDPNLLFGPITDEEIDTLPPSRTS